MESVKPIKGIVLAGGSGTRLYPITRGVSKQLLPVYDKPMVFYPISVLMLAGITEILVITTPDDQASFQRLLGDGSSFGLILKYCVQENPEGIAQALLLAEDFLNGAAACLVLGDNIFFGHGLPTLLKTAVVRTQQNIATVFGYRVRDPERYGVACLVEIAYQAGYITREQLLELAKPLLKNQYGQYLQQIADEGVF